MLKLEHSRNGIVQKRAVMGDYKNGSLELSQILGQPTDRGDIKVIGRFVQQQNVRMRQDRAREHRFAYLPARKGRDGTLLLLLGKTETDQRRARHRAERGAALAGKRIDDGCLPLDQTIAIRIALFELFHDSRFLRLQIQQRPVGFQRKRIQIDVRGKLRDLLDIGQLCPLSKSERPAVVRLLSHQDPHQRRLAGSVHADQTDTLARLDLKGYIRKQRSVRKRLLQLVHK